MMIDLSTTDNGYTRAQISDFREHGCPKCGTLPEPEPTASERKRIMEEDYEWDPPPGNYLVGGFGLMGGGYGSYVICDGCGFFGKCVEESE